jgi:flagellar biosynthetic protein FlhB
MADDRGQRTEQPTARRLGEARERGQVPRTAEAGVAMSLLAGAAFLAWAGPLALAPLVGLRDLVEMELHSGPWSPGHAALLAQRVLGAYLALAGPPILAVAVCVLAVGAVQAGGVLSTYPLKPNWGRLSPLAGLSRLLGWQALVELGKAPLKLAVLGLIAVVTIRPALAGLLLGPGQNPAATTAVVADLVLTLLWRLGLAHAALAALDWAYQRWSHRRGLRMTRQEVKDEMRQAEGDPGIRARIRSLHRQRAMRRMIQDVARAQVVITNPTHLAVALAWTPGMRAPQVLAKGARLVAQRIREAALAAGVPVVENRPLAQTLYKSVPVGGEIPASLYRAVAEVLATVWALGRRRGGSA